MHHLHYLNHHGQHLHHHHGDLHDKHQQHGHEFEEGLLCVGGQLTNMQPIRTRKFDDSVVDDADGDDDDDDDDDGDGDDDVDGDDDDDDDEFHLQPLQPPW